MLIVAACAVDIRGRVVCVGGGLFVCCRCRGCGRVVFQCRKCMMWVSFCHGCLLSMLVVCSFARCHSIFSDQYPSLVETPLKGSRPFEYARGRLVIASPAILPVSIFKAANHQVINNCPYECTR